MTKHEHAPGTEHPHGAAAHSHKSETAHQHAGETPLDPDMFGTEQPCFGCSQGHPTGFRLRFSKRGDEVVTRFVPGDGHQGPPGVMHGGLVTTLADEIAAWTVVAMKGRFGFTVALEARLSRAVRTNVEVEGRGRIAGETSRFTKIAVELHQAGAVCFKGTFTFAILDEAGAEKVIGGPLPDAWKKFAR